jgi:hypothetical protein
VVVHDGGDVEEEVMMMVMCKKRKWKKGIKGKEGI